MPRWKEIQHLMFELGQARRDKDQTKVIELENKIKSTINFGEFKTRTAAELLNDRSSAYQYIA